MMVGMVLNCKVVRQVFGEVLTSLIDVNWWRVFQGEAWRRMARGMDCRVEVASQ